MKRYISNYTILADGNEVINHITTVGDDGRLISIQPFDRELGNTVYVPIPICVTTTNCLKQVEKSFLDSSSCTQFKEFLIKAHNAHPEADDLVTVLSLDFAHKTTKTL